MTIEGHVSAPALGKVCQKDRKVGLLLYWSVGEGQPQKSLRKTVTVDASDHFSWTFNFVEPPPPAMQAPAGERRTFGVSALVDQEARRYRGKKVVCGNSYPHGGTPWHGFDDEYEYE